MYYKQNCTKTQIGGSIAQHVLQHVLITTPGKINIMEAFQKEFLQYAIDNDILKFGEFVLKSGRKSPYFFNCGEFKTGIQIAKLGQLYTKAIMRTKLEFDMIFGPAYKGIPLAVATSMEIGRQSRKDIPFAFNRKEIKDHGEGGNIVGAKLSGRVLIIDDVISAGTSVRESVELIQAAGATPVAVAISLDRQEVGESNLTAAQEVTEKYGIPVISIAGLDELIGMMNGRKDYSDRLEQISAYKAKYGSA